MLSPDITKIFIHVPQRPARSMLATAGHAVKGALLGPVFWLLAAFFPTPGLKFRLRALALGVRALLAPKRRLGWSAIFHLLFMPMESTRYFEFDFAWRVLSQSNVHRYLDVSSPRLLPIALVSARPGVAADLINPDQADLRETGRLVDLVGARERCRLHRCLVAEAPFEPGTFDAITSISVLEHIPDDAAALRRMWDLLTPGGILVLTLPCMRQACEQYIDRYDWGVLQKEASGFVFWQRLYDERLLEQRVFSVTGPPHEISLYGERIAGNMLRNAERKRGDPAYPYWREPYMLAWEYRRYSRIADLPGEGVVGMAFVKPRLA